MNRIFRRYKPLIIVWLAGFVFLCILAFAGCPSADLTGGRFVDLKDLALMADQWLTGTPNAQSDPVCLAVSPVNAIANDDVTVTAYDQYDNMLDLGLMGAVELCFGEAGCVWTEGTGPEALDVSSRGGVFTITQAMLDSDVFDFYAAGPDVWFTLANPSVPSPFDTVAQAVAAGGSCPPGEGEILYNGIALPHTWPPRYPSIRYEPMPVPYLENPPAVIPIDIGRQLFVDDFLIETTTMNRNFHQPEYYAQNPVLTPETSCEVNSEGHWFAAPFSGGAFYDPRDSLFKLYYRGGSSVCYATSTDGLNWEKPNLDANPVGLLHHFTCTPSNPSTNDQVTIRAYDQYNQQLDLANWDIIEFCFFGGAGCVETGNSTITIDETGGAVFTVTQAMLDDGKSFDFNAYKATSPPETEVFKLPFPFDTIERGGNAVYPFSEVDAHHIDSTSILLDHNAPAAERFKYFATEFPGGGAWLTYRISSDGIHWSGAQGNRVKIWGDRTTVLYNPFREVWICSQRTEDAVGRRARSYVEGPTVADLMAEVTYNEIDQVEGNSVHWVGADYLDPRHTDSAYSDMEPQLYTLDAAPYESLMLGQFSIWQGPTNVECGELWVPKRCDILLGFSRDGFHWDRPSRKRFISCTWDEGSWRYGNVQSVVGGPLVVDDELYFYFSARPKPAADAPGWDADGHTGLAILRRDGFASMDAGGSAETLTTRPVTFQGKYLFVNVMCPQGKLNVEVLDKNSQVIVPFTLLNCNSISSDTTQAQVSWGRYKDLAALAGQPIRFRFHLTNGSLFAFWVSSDYSGASRGYVGAGGPGFTGPMDTVGQRAARTSGKEEY